MSQSLSVKSYRRFRSERLSEAVVRAVADAEGVDPIDLDTPLYEAIDPDALDRLFESQKGRPTGRLTFSYRGYDVCVTADGQLTLI